ncbi:ATP-binding protein [Streptomyces sp. NPDC026665]|uniref:ATP-binding protein n=1 Tax=Streptomyces sp. NPDC026665 TaxID=3154798 RepID=UPI0033D610FB
MSLSGAHRLPWARPQGRSRRARSLSARLLALVGLALFAVCVTMAFSAVLAQRAYLLDDLDRRVAEAAERGRDGVLGDGPGAGTGLGSFDGRGQPAGTITARLGADGTVVVAEVVSRSGEPRRLRAAQRSALAGIEPDGSPHTRTVPGLGVYRVAALDGGGRPVLTALPMDGVQDAVRGLAVVETVVAAGALTLVGSVCAVVVRRRLRPIERVAAAAVEICRSPPAGDETADPDQAPGQDARSGSEADQIGAALDRLTGHAVTAHTERLRAERETRRGEERTRRFIADASHELRTPLASIAGYAELMNRGTGGGEAATAWRRVSAESARMTGLVEDLLLLARLDEGHPPQAAEVDLRVLVAEAVREARAAGEGHDWHLAGLPDSPALVAGDAARLRRVVANLLANARAHTPAGTTVVVTLEATGAVCVIRVRDDGPGIPPALLPDVFERFTRADASRSRVSPGHGGSGLGLAVVAAVTKAHGGRIRAESTPGRTEFTIELPTLRPVPPPRPAPAPVPLRPAPAPVPPRPAPAPVPPRPAPGSVPPRPAPARVPPRPASGSVPPRPLKDPDPSRPPEDPVQPGTPQGPAGGERPPAPRTGREAAPRTGREAAPRTGGPPAPRTGGQAAASPR